jgi:hypothetical protein
VFTDLDEHVRLRAALFPVTPSGRIKHGDTARHWGFGTRRCTGQAHLLVLKFPTCRPRPHSALIRLDSPFNRSLRD